MNVSEIVSIVAAITALYAIISNHRLRKSQERLNLSEVDSQNIEDALKLKQEYKEALREMRQELEAEKKARDTVEKKLSDAHALISELQIKDIRREASMNDLEQQFKRDAILRANIETALDVATKRITTLESDNKSMRDRIGVLESERATWRAGIKTLIQQVIEHNDEPRWKPPDTQPLGKLAT